MIDLSVGRLPDLVPLRNRRMLASPFAFFRGSARQMALDLASTPSSGIDVQLCGDAHLVIFGIFASPERSLVFDLNDFDETWPGPFEWTGPETGVHYYLRQLWDAKGSADVSSMNPASLVTYVSACGWALARAHARTGDSSAIAGYVGRSPRFDQAVASFALAYADQNERDHAALRQAADNGRVPVAPSA